MRFLTNLSRASLALVFLACGQAFAADADPGYAARAERALAPEQFLYQYLLSEIAAQRGEPIAAARGLMDLAARTRDAKVARRAVEIAYQAGQPDSAREGAILWLDIEPNSVMARQLLSRLAGGTHDATVANLRSWLNEPRRAPTLLLQIPAMLARYPDKARLLASTHELAARYLSLPEAHFALAQAELYASNASAAMASAEQALVLRANWAPAAILKAQLLRERGENVAADYLKSFLKNFPAESDVRLAYARALVLQKNLREAREEFRRVATELPGDGEIPYAIGLLSQQLGDPADAQTQYQRVLTLKPNDPNPVWFNLGEVATVSKDVPAALSWYRKVTAGDYFVGAQLKMAALIAKRDGVAAGRKHLREAREADANSPDTNVQLILAEAQLLRDNKSFVEAYAFLSDALRATPDVPDLIYDRAMMAEKLNKFDIFEADLKRVIALKPDHAHAHNALGYTLAEQGKRLDEAQQWIEKAIALAPNDAFIQDSLGWVQFRKGNREAALATLKKAYAARPDPEIAAHLGEVMHSLGQRAEAHALWRAALVEHPGNEIITGIMEKLKP